VFKKIISVPFFIMVGLSNVHADTGITLGATRLVYNSQVSQASIDVINSDERAYLIQSWVSKSTDSKLREDHLFVTTPPLFRLEPDSTNSVRVVYVGDSLPQDRESVLWLNIKSIPSIKKTNNNTLAIAIKSQIKLFYRPEGLRDNAVDAYKKIKFLERNSKLVINNPTPFVISFNEIKIAGVLLEDNVMALPFSEQIINKKVSAGQTVTWQTINDYGGTTPATTAKIIK